MEASADGKALRLSLRAEPKLLPVATSFAENFAKACGLDSKEALSLALATEEIFMRLCGLRSDAPPLELLASGGGFRAELEFNFDGSGFDMRAFNITAKASADFSEESLSETGLILAARSVDSFSISAGPGGALKLRLVKERAYHGAARTERFEMLRAKSWSVHPAGPEELHLLCRMLPSLAAPGLVPDFLRIPAKAADMLVSGRLSARLAKAPDGAICGGILWRALSSKAIECFGPYPFLSEGAARLARELLDAFVSSVCKGDAAVVLARHAEEEWASGFFEPLGGPGGASGLKAFFRQLGEDSGSTLWVSSSIEEYVKGECGRLFLPRNIVLRESGCLGEANPHSVISAALDREGRRAVMRPARQGADLDANISAHLKALKAEGFSELLFELDLGAPWHCSFADSLTAAGFAPKLLLPSAGEGDILAMLFNG